jgi:hypothetical protein
VACVDDAARAVAVLALLWQRTGLEWVRNWAEGLLDFVLAMQTDDGWWLNFIRDWDGERNLHGPTSFAGGRFWHARALYGTAIAATVLESEPARAATARGLQRSLATPAASDVRAVELEAGLVLSAAGLGPDPADLDRWADEIAACREGDVLLNWSGERGQPHLWGHIQEGVLARAAADLGRPELLAIARDSADALVVPVVDATFDLPTVQPYGVASLIFSLDRLAAATGDALYAAPARAARQWFLDRNPAHAPVYDTEAGRVGDGIDDGAVNPNSGAESNICAADALMDDAAELARRLDPTDLGLDVARR